MTVSGALQAFSKAGPRHLPLRKTIEVCWKEETARLAADVYFNAR